MKLSPASRSVVLAVSFCGALAAALPGRAATGDLALSSLAATCAACHGTDGNALHGTAMPRLAGLPRNYFLMRMRSFREGTAGAPVMRQIAKGYSETQVAALADFFERQRPLG